MKLRNKITKEIWNIPEWRTPAVQEGDISFFAELNGEGKLFSYKSLDDLDKEWEDYKPAEPLIKDEKIRKAVRLWAELNGIDELNHYFCDGSSCFIFTDEKGNDCSLDFTFRIDNLKSNTDYAIAELCGEEEE